MSVNSNIVEFNEALIQKIGAACNKRVGFIAKGITEALVDSVVPHTPVKSGKARDNWNVNIGTPDLEVRPAGQPQNHSAAYDRITGQQEIFITNNVPYIRKLENGSSKQAPAGMARAAEVDARNALQKILDQAEKEIPLT